VWPIEVEATLGWKGIGIGGDHAHRKNPAFTSVPRSVEQGTTYRAETPAETERRIGDPCPASVGAL
jgi:hypothetical protein